MPALHCAARSFGESRSRCSESARHSSAVGVLPGADPCFRRLLVYALHLDFAELELLIYVVGLSFVVVPRAEGTPQKTAAGTVLGLNSCIRCPLVYALDLHFAELELRSHVIAPLAEGTSQETAAGVVLGSDSCLR